MPKKPRDVQRDIEKLFKSDFGIPIPKREKVDPHKPTEPIVISHFYRPEATTEERERVEQLVLYGDLGKTSDRTNKIHQLKIHLLARELCPDALLKTCGKDDV